ncbi:MAG: Gfo/Idh/MocA family oxidoreductase [Armatimonadota bacterium]
MACRRSAASGGATGYQGLLETDVDIVMLVTPPLFRPLHLEATIRAGKHAFIEKPVAVDPPGCRRVIAAGEEAKRNGLVIVAGTEMRHHGLRCVQLPGGQLLGLREDGQRDVAELARLGDLLEPRLVGRLVAQEDEGRGELALLVPRGQLVELPGVVGHHVVGRVHEGDGEGLAGGVARETVGLPRLGPGHDLYGQHRGLLPNNRTWPGHCGQGPR